MTPEQFIAKWQAADLKERAAAQSHFNDLCELLGEPKPTDADPKGEWYCFERGATKTTGGEGWADVWKRGCFGWEYKSRGKNLDEAIDQLKRYALALENPPLLIASNLDRFRIVTNWTNAISARHEFDLDGLRDPGNRHKLKWAFSDPEQLRPGLTRRHVTEIAAQKFAGLATDLRIRGYEPHAVAHFVNRLVFCMFAEDIGLLPNRMFTRMLEEARRYPAVFEAVCRDLFAAMKAGGRVGFERVDWFNGGLFDDDSTLPLTRPHIDQVLDAASMDWSEIDPSIMGTLFERGLDPDKRSQLGAHYTDAEKIMKIILPVIQRPLEAEWAETKAKIEDQLARTQTSKAASARTRARNEAARLYKGFLDRVRAFRVLDPACGSGNFLYLALQTLKDIEHRAGIEAEALGLPREFPQVGPEQLLGIEINPYAAELARISVWIGEIQWMQRNGFGVAKNPILRPLDTIECRDAILNLDGTEPQWPAPDVIIGNPPFLGDKLMIGVLGEEYVATLRRAYLQRVPGGADLVCYWFEKARALCDAGLTTKVGLVATNSIRGGANRTVLDRIRQDHAFFEVWSDEAWTIEGAAVRVALVCFEAKATPAAVRPRLNGVPVGEIFADLSSGLVDLTVACRLPENHGISFIGRQKDGPVDVPGDLARKWIEMPSNPNNRSNTDVIHPFMNGADVTRRPSGRWLIDFKEMSEAEASFYEAPFEYLRVHLKPIRQQNRDRQRRDMWWRPGRSGADLRRSLAGISRYIATPRVGTHRLFVWLHGSVVPDCQLVVVACDDDKPSAFSTADSMSCGSCAYVHGSAWGMIRAIRHRPHSRPFPFPKG